MCSEASWPCGKISPWDAGEPLVRSGKRGWVGPTEFITPRNGQITFRSRSRPPPAGRPSDRGETTLHPDDLGSVNAPHHPLDGELVVTSLADRYEVRPADGQLHQLDRLVVEPALRTSQLPLSLAGKPQSCARWACRPTAQGCTSVASSTPWMARLSRTSERSPRRPVASRSRVRGAQGGRPSSRDSGRPEPHLHRSAFSTVSNKPHGLINAINSVPHRGFARFTV
jgi:hypothetical protein